MNTSLLGNILFFLIQIQKRSKNYKFIFARVNPRHTLDDYRPKKIAQKSERCFSFGIGDFDNSNIL